MIYTPYLKQVRLHCDRILPELSESLIATETDPGRLYS